MNVYKRPLVVTAVGIVGILAGTLPLADTGAALASARFAAWFLPLVRSMLPVCLLSADRLLWV